jgi:hypothetical protein
MTFDDWFNRLLIPGNKPALRGAWDAAIAAAAQACDGISAENHKQAGLYKETRDWAGTTRRTGGVMAAEHCAAAVRSLAMGVK